MRSIFLSITKNIGKDQRNEMNNRRLLMVKQPKSPTARRPPTQSQNQAQISTQQRAEDQVKRTSLVNLNLTRKVKKVIRKISVKWAPRKKILRTTKMKLNNQRLMVFYLNTKILQQRRKTLPLRLRTLPLRPRLKNRRRNHATKL